MNEEVTKKQKTAAPYHPLRESDVEVWRLRVFKMLKEENSFVCDLVTLGNIPVFAFDTATWFGVRPESGRPLPARNSMTTAQKNEYRDIRAELSWGRRCIKTLEFILCHSLPIATIAHGYSICGGGWNGMRLGLDPIQKEVRLTSGPHTLTIAPFKTLQMAFCGGAPDTEHFRALALVYALTNTDAMVVQVSSLDCLPKHLFETVIFSEPLRFVEEEEETEGEDDNESPSIRLKVLGPDDSTDLVYCVWVKKRGPPWTP